MSDTAFSIPSSERHALAAPPHRAAAVKRWSWRLAPWLLPALLFALWSVGSARGWIAPQILPPPERVFDALGRSRDERRPRAPYADQPAARAGRLRRRHAARLRDRRRARPVTHAGSLRAAELQCARADSGARLATVPAVARRCRRAAQVPADRACGARPRHAEHVARVSSDAARARRSRQRIRLHAAATHRARRAARRDPDARDRRAARVHEVVARARRRRFRRIVRRPAT